METDLSSVKEQLKENLDEKSYSLWMKPLQFTDLDGDTISVGCPNRFSRNWVEENYSSLIQTQFSRAGHTNQKIIFRILPNKRKNNNPSMAINTDSRQLILPNMPKRAHRGEKFLNARFTFDKFVVGKCNEFAYSVSRSLADDSSVSYSSLFLLGETGLGKSHLIQAIGNSIMQKRPGVRFIYLTAEDFTNEMIFALRNNKIEEFKNKYRKLCDILLLEEMHFLSGKEKTQVELGYTLDSLFNAGKKVIFTSPLKPKEIPNMKSMLSSRLTSGILTNIEKPDFETRLSILKQKAAERGISLHNKVAQYIAENLSQDIRQLEGALDSIKANSFFLKKEVNMCLATEIVRQLIPEKKSATVEDIQQLVCKYFKLDTEQLRSKSRKKIISYPRSIAIHLSRKFTDKSLQAIGVSFKRNHSTILYDDEKVKKNLQTDNDLKKEVEFFCRQIEAGAS